MKKKYNLLLPIAGRAQRFLNENYLMPKPLIMCKDRHIIDWSMDSLDTNECNLIFAVRLEHVNNFSIDEILRKKYGDIKILIIDKVTDGAVSTCLLAKEYIDNDLPLIIYTPDVYFENKFNPTSVNGALDGFLLTFKANSPAHSYVEVGEDDLAIRTAEKEVISQNAAVGVYYYKSGSEFVKYAEKLISKNIRTKGEFYICPIYNLMIQDGLKVGIRQVEKMHVLGTPSELEFFTKNVVSYFGQKPIALCSDHSGFKLKEKAKEILEKNNIPFIDFGCYVDRDCDYNEYVEVAVKSISEKECDFGLGFCRTGQGVNILANHLQGIRSALVLDEYMARCAVEHNCANFFAIPEKYVSEEIMEQMIEIWKTTSFDGGRHMTRMEKTIGKKNN
jgi:RpiB/LacA/LacB family sugar-phosphate isomerase